MKIGLVLILSISFFEAITHNWLVEDALDNIELSYENKKYNEVQKSLLNLKDSLSFWGMEQEINLGHAFYHQNTYGSSSLSYQNAVRNQNKTLSSIAFNQLALSFFYQNKGAKILEQRSVSLDNEEVVKVLTTTLDYLKKSLLKNPKNEEARYNYEVLSLLKQQAQEEQEKQEKKDKKDQNKDKQDQKKKDQEKKEGDQNKDQDKKGDQDSDQNKKDQQKKGDKKNKKDNKEGKGKKQKDQSKGKKSEDQKKNEKPDKQVDDQKENASEGEKSKEELKKEQEAAIRQRLKENQMSKERAEQLLKSMEQQQIKYLQQQKRKAPRSSNSDKPQW